MFKVIVLICSLSTPGPDCDQKSAVDVVDLGEVQNSMQCGFFGQAHLAPTSVAPEPGKQYQKILCVREKREAAK